MAVLLNNVTTLDDYDNAVSIGPVHEATQLTVVVANQSVFMELMRGTYGAVDYAQELLVTPSAFSLQRALGARFRSAVAGKPAQVIAIAWEPTDPQPLGSSPFTQSLAASGSVTPGQASVQMAKDGVLIGTEPIVNLISTLGFLSVVDSPGNQRVDVQGGFALAKIGRVTVGVGGAASVDFSNIPQTYAHLKLVTLARYDAAVLEARPSLRFNNDSAANYDYQQLVATAATVVAFEGIGGTSALYAEIPGSTAAGGEFAIAEVIVPFYTGVVAGKSFVSQYGEQHSLASGGLRVGLFAGGWRSTAAITRITLFPPSGNFVQSSDFILYGVA